VDGLVQGGSDAARAPVAPGPHAVDAGALAEARRTLFSTPSAQVEAVTSRSGTTL